MNTIHNPHADIIKKLLDEQDELIDMLIKIRKAIVSLGGEVSNDIFNELLTPDGKAKPLRPLRVPEYYNDHLPKIEKIAFAINALKGEATSSEIADWIIEWDHVDSSQNKAIIKRNITLLISYLYRNGRLRVKKEGGKYKYCLK